MLPRFQNCFPAANTEGLVYPAEHENFEWTTSFLSGMLWLLYEHTGEADYLPVLQNHLESFYHRVEDLASDASNFVNGHILYVDGGILAYIGKQP